MKRNLQRHQACQEEYADELSTREIAQLRNMVIEQEDVMVCLEANSQHASSRQHEEYAHKQQTLFQKFDGAIKDKDEVVHA